MLGMTSMFANGGPGQGSGMGGVIVQDGPDQ
jgi:hypothetical protein